MKVVYAHDNVYISHEGAVYSAGQFAYSYWSPYLEAFGKLTVIGRMRELKTGEDLSKFQRADGDNVEILGAPDMNSPLKLLRNRDKVELMIAMLLQDADGVIIRAMSEIGWLTYKQARRQKLRIAHELSGCPWDNTWHHGSWTAKFYAPIRWRRARKVARKADAVLYVTKEFLPRRYPAGRFALKAIASNVRIDPPEDAILKKRVSRIKAVFGDKETPITFGLIGHLDHKLKGIDVALKALAVYNQKTKKPFTFKILGPGNAARYAKAVKQYKLEDKVKFEGTLPSGEPVLKWLDEVDVYMQPSFHEGLPRALIEALSRGALCFGSTAGGIPELLPKERLHKPGDHVRLATQLYALLDQDAEDLTMIAKRNFAKAQDYTSDKLVPVRQAFWKNFARLIQKRVIQP
ncbi:MAG: glycosyltransferase [Pseudobdellovibrionaceae bacterium]